MARALPTKSVTFSRSVPQATDLARNKGTTFQILKGLSLSKTCGVPSVTAKASNLLMLGDISAALGPQYQEIIHAASKDFHHVFFVAGQLEYDGRETGEVDCFLQSLSRHYNNVTFLQKNCVLVRPDLVVAGSTMRLGGECLPGHLAHAIDCQHPYRHLLYVCYKAPLARHLRMFPCGVKFVNTEDDYPNNATLTI